jgi:hypothetical protein
MKFLAWIDEGEIDGFNLALRQGRSCLNSESFLIASLFCNIVFSE